MLLLRRFLIRLLTMAVTLFGVAVVVFVVIRVAPGDPIAMMLPPGASQADIDRLRALYGLDKSLLEQFFIWLAGVLHGDFGTSISLRQNVLGLVLSRLPATLELAHRGAADRRGDRRAAGGRRRARARHARSKPASTSPTAPRSPFPISCGGWCSSCCSACWCRSSRFPAASRRASNCPSPPSSICSKASLRLRFDLTSDLLSHMFMPALALALPLAAIISQLLKQSLKEAAGARLCRAGRASRAFREPQVILREALQNAALPTLTLIGVQFTFLIGGTVIVERIFSYEGLGNMAIDAVINRDLPLIQGIVLVFALLFVLINLAVDMTYALLNPRLRHG